MEEINTKLEDLKLRYANEDDATLVYSYIMKLAVYQKMSQLKVNVDKVAKLLRDKQEEVVLAVWKGEVCGFAMVYEYASGFFGSKCMFLDLFYVDEDKRNLGIGTVLFDFISSIAVKQGCGRLEWLCLNWNHSSRNFYSRLGASEIEVMNTFRIEDEILEQHASAF